MAFYIKPFRNRPGNYANTYDIKMYLGLKPEQKWPKSAMWSVPVRLTDGRTTGLWLEAFEPLPNHNGRPVKSSKHRAMVACPDCYAYVSAGRTHQHKCKG